MEEGTSARANPGDAGVVSSGLSEGDEELIDVELGCRAALEDVVNVRVLLGFFALGFLNRFFGIVVKIMDGLRADIKLAEFGFRRIGGSGELVREIANGAA